MDIQKLWTDMATRNLMTSVDKNESSFTYQRVTAWREQLWPLGRYLWAGVLQAIHFG
jgi:hypothetical protein